MHTAVKISILGGASVTVMVNCMVLAAPAASVTVTVNGGEIDFDVPGANIYIPEITPFGARLSPAGRFPAVTAQV